MSMPRSFAKTNRADETDAFFAVRAKTDKGAAALPICLD